MPAPKKVEMNDCVEEKNEVRNDSEVESGRVTKTRSSNHLRIDEGNMTEKESGGVRRVNRSQNDSGGVNRTQTA